MRRLSQFRILLVLVLCYRLVPAAIASSSQEPSITTTHAADNRPTRTLFHIVLGCASTILISAWRSVHPNIPSQQSYLRRIFRKLDILVCTIIAPEILPLWALKQCLAAARIRDMYNNRPGRHVQATTTGTDMTRQWFSMDDIEDDNNEDWSATHGHYLIMGGFQLVEPVIDERGESPNTPNVDAGQRKFSWSYADSPTRMGSPAQQTVQSGDAEKGPVPATTTPGRAAFEVGRKTILTPEMLAELVKDPKFEISVAEREINDRSRADVISKFIFALQTWWFTTQCVARGVQGLELTQLELTTVAFSSLNVISFLLWMKKPLGAQVPMRIHMYRRLTDAEREAGRDPARYSFRSSLPGYIKKATKILQAKRLKFWTRLVILPFLVLAVVLSPIIIVVVAITFTFYDVMITSSSYPSDAAYVPPFYTPKPKSWLHPIILSMLCFTVGGIHCAGWNLTFPTDTQRDLWRAASLTITVLPVLMLVVLEFIFKGWNKTNGMGQKVRYSMFVVSVVAYVATRVFLVAQALALLKDQPPSAFVDVDWMKFVPHA